MKINAITPYSSNFASKSNFKNNKSKFVSSPSFEGIFDVFKKQSAEKTPAQQDSDDINEILKSAIEGDKALKKNSKALLNHLNAMLKEGKEKDYRGYLHFTDQKLGQNTVTFGDVDEELKVPSVINVWQEGKLKTVYKIESVIPQSIYTVTIYNDDRETFYRFINDKNLAFQSIDKDGIILAHYPAENGFCQQQSKKINEKDAILFYELYWDYKHPENSYLLQNTDDEAIRFGYDKKKKFWYEKEIIPYDEKGEIPTYNS